jgi:hypothetical protein
MMDSEFEQVIELLTSLLHRQQKLLHIVSDDYKNTMIKATNLVWDSVEMTAVFDEAMYLVVAAEVIGGQIGKLLADVDAAFLLDRAAKGGS